MSHSESSASIILLIYYRVSNDEDKILKDLIETNIRQRGMGNPNAVKMGRCLVELERIYGIQHGNNQRTSTLLTSSKTQDDLINSLDINRESYHNYKRLTTLIPELQDLVQDEAISPSVASRILAKLTEEEQKQKQSIKKRFDVRKGRIILYKK